MRRTLALLALTATVGCYHATVDTGLAPSGQTIAKPWANSFVYGLVPPPVVETTSKCPNGVAKVETDGGGWHTLEYRAVGPKLVATVDGKATATAWDSYFMRGRVGLWTKSDGVSEFDDFAAEPVSE